MANQVRRIETQHLFNNFNKCRSNTKKIRQPFPRLMKIVNVEKPCSSNNFGITEIVFHSNMTKSLIKDKEAMTDDYQESVPVRFCKLTHENDVPCFTGLQNTRIFQTLFNSLQTKASVMTYCDGNKKTLIRRKMSGSIELTETLLSSPDIEFNKGTMLKTGPKCKLALE